MKHDVLKKIEADLTQANVRQTTQVNVADHLFTLQVLKRGEETEARTLVTAENLFQAFADSHVPQLAYAIQSIDGVSKSELFTPETDKEREEFDANPRRWRARQLVEWLNEQGGVVVERLWIAYTDLKGEGRQSLEAIENFAKRAETDSGASVSTSSPEKES